MSVELASIMDEVLPSSWTDDARQATAIQWTVYTFVEETSESDDLRDRTKESFEYAAEVLDTNRTTIKRWCTTSLYDDSSGSTAKFPADLRKIANEYGSN